MVINAIGSNLDGFLKFIGSTDAGNIGTSQAGTASTALTQMERQLQQLTLMD